jgi:hypothetical protein
MAFKKELLDALQVKMRTLMQPLYNEQAVLRADTDRLFDATSKRIARLEAVSNDLTASILYSRWLTAPDSVGSRKEAGHWLNWLGLNGEGVEVGVFQGEFSEHLLSTWECSRLTSIDPWREFPAAEYVDTCNFSQEVHDQNHAVTVARLARFADRSRVMKTTSADAATCFEDGSLDFVYLDAQHHYEAVRDDIALWFPKVKRGGVIGGHDYLDGRLPSGLYGVKTAVFEFVRSHNCELIITREPSWPSWFAKLA